MINSSGDGDESIADEDDIYDNQATKHARDALVAQLVAEGRVTEVPDRQELELLNVMMLKDLCEDVGIVRSPSSCTHRSALCPFPLCAASPHLRAELSGLFSSATESHK